MSTVDSAIQADQLLLEAKQQCQHGEWRNWLKQRCKLSFRQANRYMEVARHAPLLGSNETHIASHFSIRGLLGAFGEATMSSTGVAQPQRVSAPRAEETGQPSSLSEANVPNQQEAPKPKSLPAAGQRPSRIAGAKVHAESVSTSHPACPAMEELAGVDVSLFPALDAQASNLAANALDLIGNISEQLGRRQSSPKCEPGAVENGLRNLFLRRFAEAAKASPVATAACTAKRRKSRNNMAPPTK